MGSQPKPNDVQQTSDSPQETTSAETGFGGIIVDQCKRIKEHAEMYPYVWGSYVLVYGGLGLWLSYRWRKLRRTEDRVRVLQERLRKLVEEEQSTSSAAVKENPLNSVNSTSKASSAFGDKVMK